MLTQSFAHDAHAPVVCAQPSGGSEEDGATRALRCITGVRLAPGYPSDGVFESSRRSTVLHVTGAMAESPSDRTEIALAKAASQVARN
jgi:hypothetical protein